MYILHKSEAWISTPLTQRKFSEKRLFFCLFRHRSKLHLFLCCICNSILHFSYIFAKSLAVKQQKAPASGIVPYVRAFFVSYRGHTNVPCDYRRAGIRSAQEKIPVHGWYPYEKELRGAGKKRRPSFRGKSSDIPLCIVMRSSSLPKRRRSPPRRAHASKEICRNSLSNP